MPQIGDFKRFGQIIIGSGLHRFDDNLNILVNRYHENGAIITLLANLAQNFQS